MLYTNLLTLLKQMGVEIWDVSNPQVKDILAFKVSPYLSQCEKTKLLSISNKWKNLVSNKRFWKGKLIINDVDRNLLTSDKIKDYFCNLLNWVTIMGTILSNITHLTTNIIRTNDNDKIFEQIYSQILLVATITTLELVATESSLYLLKNCTHRLTNLILHIEVDVRSMGSMWFDNPLITENAKLKNFLHESLQIAYPNLQNYTITNQYQKIPYKSSHYSTTNCIVEISNMINIQEQYPKLEHFSLQTSEELNESTKYNIDKLYSKCKHLKTLTLDYFGIGISWENDKLKNIGINALLSYNDFLKNDIFNDLLQLENNDQNKIPNLNVQCCSFPNIKVSVDYNELFLRVRKMTIICNCMTHLVKHKDIVEELPKIREINPHMQIEFVIKAVSFKEEKMQKIKCDELDKYINVCDLGATYISKQKHMTIVCKTYIQHKCDNKYSYLSKPCEMCEHSNSCTRRMAEFIKKHNTFTSCTIEIFKYLGSPINIDIRNICDAVKLMGYNMKCSMRSDNKKKMDDFMDMLTIDITRTSVEIWDVSDPQVSDILSYNVSPYFSQCEKTKLSSISKKWKNLVSNKKFWKGKLIINDIRQKFIPLKMIKYKDEINDYYNGLLNWVTNMGPALSNITELTTNIIRTDDQNTIFEQIYMRLILFAPIRKLEIVATNSSLYLLKSCAPNLTHLTLHVEVDIHHIENNYQVENNNGYQAQNYNQDSLPRKNPFTVQNKNLKQFLSESLEIVCPNLTNYMITNKYHKLETWTRAHYRPLEFLIELRDKMKMKEKYPNLKHFSLQTSENFDPWFIIEKNNYKLYLECRHLSTLKLDYYGVQMYWIKDELKDISIKALLTETNLQNNHIFKDLLESPNNYDSLIPNLNVDCNSLLKIKKSVNYDVIFTRIKKMTIICNCGTHLVKHKDICDILPKIREINPDMKIEFIIKDTLPSKEHLQKISCKKLKKYINICELDPNHVSKNKQKHMTIICADDYQHRCNNYSFQICGICDHQKTCTHRIAEFIKKNNIFTSCTLELSSDLAIKEIFDVAKSMDYNIVQNDNNQNGNNRLGVNLSITKK